MADYVVMIPTFNRGDLLFRVLDKLRNETFRCDTSCKVLVWNDGSTLGLDRYEAIDREFCQKQSDGFTVAHHRYRANRGRRGFWKTLTELMTLAKAETFNYALMLPDDCLPCDRFFTRITERFRQLQAEDQLAPVVAMNLICTLLRNWGRGRFVDNVFLADRRFFDVLNWALKPARGRWGDNPRAGSGTGHQMTKRIVESKLVRIAPNQDCSWLKPIIVPSVMFPSDVRPRVWWRDNYVGDDDECGELRDIAKCDALAS